LRKELQTLGWIEGRNIQSDYRWAGPDPDRARTFAKELVGMSPDVIVSSTNQVTAIVQHETRTIPIVFAFVGDPVGSGFVQSLLTRPTSLNSWRGTSSTGPVRILWRGADSNKGRVVAPAKIERADSWTLLGN
jgi:hypothetical protein